MNFAKLIYQFPSTCFISGTTHFHELSLLQLERAWSFEKKKAGFGRRPQ